MFSLVLPQEKKQEMKVERPQDSPAMQSYKNQVGFCLSQEEQARFDGLLRTWNARPSSLRAATSQEYQHGKLQKMDLLALSDLEREEEFDRRADFFDWEPGTCAQYWSMVIKLSEDCGLPVSYSMRIKAKVLGFLARESVPGRPTTPLPLQQLWPVLDLLSHDLKAAVGLAFLLGQRMGDVLKLQAGSVANIEDMATQHVFTAVTFRQGKTTRRRQPYTLHLPANTVLAMQLHDLQKQTCRSVPLFLRSSGGDPEKALTTIRGVLRQQDSSLSILSIRRGGLQRMAQMGASLECMLQHSRHSTQCMLERYLGYGKLLFGAARERFVPAEKQLTQEAQQYYTADFLQALNKSLGAENQL
jgi:hypothetical protein